jgi:AcrR family transcriptional regulator
VAHGALREGEVVVADEPASSHAGRTRKSDRTKHAILTAARRQFEQQGYDRTSIRAVAAAADIDPSMVMRYFGSKEGLFAEAVRIDLRLPDLAAVPAPNRGRALVEHFVRRWEGDLSDDVLVILLRSAVTNESAARRLHAVFQEQLVESLARYCERPEAVRRAGLVASQVLGLAVTRYLLRMPGVADRPPDELVADVAPTLQRYLEGS